MAEGILKKIAADDGRTDIQVLSGGLFAEEGSAASENAILAAAERGVDISGHRSANVNPEVVRQADLILAMTEAHKRTLIDVYGAPQEKTFTLSEYAGINGDIADPFGGTLEVYRACAAQLYDALRLAYTKMNSVAES